MAKPRFTADQLRAALNDLTDEERAEVATAFNVPADRDKDGLWQDIVKRVEALEESGKKKTAERPDDFLTRFLKGIGL